ncbi:GNAT family N-acetyltransferase [Streptosporangium sp. NPDC051022]|uniref:GNAT family N-acetyltransferase n=1 Tax=Streptosporangium sp. NPDC051022 TaxID=3155752 RepID=UPI003435F322
MIERVLVGGADPVIGVIAEAFLPLDSTAWLIPDPEERRRTLAEYFAILVEHALEHGEVYGTADRSAVAVWLPRDGEAPPGPADYDSRMADACGPNTDRFRLLDALFSEAHPHGAHHHLALLAVHPERQGAGLGSSLLEDRHRVLDRDGVPAYLEASSLRSRALYLRHGYEPCGEPFALPDGSLFHPMWRTPAPGRGVPREEVRRSPR